MKQEEDNWIRNIRDRMKDYSEPVTDGGWEALEKELSDLPVINTHISYYRWWTAAAVVALLVISSFTVWFLNISDIHYPVDEAKNTGLANADYHDILKPEVPVKTTQYRREISLSRKSLMPGLIKDEVITEFPDSEHEECNNSEQEAADTVSDDMKTSTRDKQSIERKRSYANLSKQKTLLADVPMKKHHKWSIGLSAGNGFHVTNDNNKGFGTLSGREMKNANTVNLENLLLNGGAQIGLQQGEQAYRQILLNSMNKDVATDIKHHLPVTVGLSFRLQLFKRMAVETGISYTLLSSDLKSGSEMYFYKSEQKLHYIGIPLRASWTFIDKKRFMVYLSAGGTMEKSVYGKLKTDYITDGKVSGQNNERVKVKPLQWSVSSGIGVQYNITGHLGIYAEPGVIHYFDDGSDIMTIRKDKPTNFNLQMGLRLNY